VKERTKDLQRLPNDKADRQTVDLLSKMLESRDMGGFTAITIIFHPVWDLVSLKRGFLRPRACTSF